MTAGQITSMLFEVAGNGEEQVLQELINRAGLEWECANEECADLGILDCTTPKCPECGRERPERCAKVAAALGDTRIATAAPELLAALEALVPIVWNDGPLPMAYRDRGAAAERAIVKARGK